MVFVIFDGIVFCNKSCFEKKMISFIEIVVVDDVLHLE